MARPNKFNLQYFPLDVTFFDDYKTLMIEEDYGVKGGYLAIRLLAMVYEQGYFLVWNDKQEISIAKRVGLGFTSSLVMEILDSCLTHGLFNKDMFERYAVLTSNGIQKRWLQVMTQLRRKTDIDSKIWLVSSEETGITSEETPISSEETTTPATFSTQKESKLKESKEDKIKANTGKAALPPIALAISSDLSQKPVIPKKRFVAPLLEAVKSYFEKTIGNVKNTNCWPSDRCVNEAAQLFDHYTANGWIQGRGKPILDWEAACRNWIRNAQKGTFSYSSQNVTITGKNATETGVNVTKTRVNAVSINKIASEINYLYECFLEDKCTIISIEYSHYDYLKDAGMLSFDQEQINVIKANAIAHHTTAVDEKTMNRTMKKFGVLEFFKQLQAQCRESVFTEDSITV